MTVLDLVDSSRTKNGGLGLGLDALAPVECLFSQSGLIMSPCHAKLGKKTP